MKLLRSITQSTDGRKVYFIGFVTIFYAIMSIVYKFATAGESTPDIQEEVRLIITGAGMIGFRSTAKKLEMTSMARETRRLAVFLIAALVLTFSSGAAVAQETQDVQSQLIRKSRESAKRAGVRLALRKLERQTRRAGDRQKANDIREVLADPEKFDAFYAGHVKPAMVQALGEYGDTPIIDLFTSPEAVASLNHFDWLSHGQVRMLV